MDYLEQTVKRADVGIAYIYCDYNNVEQTTINLLASLLQQLALQNPTITEDLATLYDSHKAKRTRLSLEEYSTYLRASISSFSNVLIIIDGLDECPQHERHGIRSTFLREIRALQPKAQLLVTSRDIPAIALELEDAVRLNIHASEEAIVNYLEARISSSANLKRHVRKYSALRNTIIETITRKAEGM